MAKVIGVCNLCEAICGLELTVDVGPDGPDVTAIRGNPADPLSRGHICPKGVALADAWRDPDRLRRPIRRRGDQWDEIGWDEALDLVADRLAATVRNHGSDAIAAYLGNPNVHSLGSMTHGTALFKALGTKNRYSATSVDQLPHQLVAHLMFGHQLFLPVPDLDRTQHLIVIGANPMASNGSLMTAPDFPRRMRRLKARGGRLVVIDPRRTETAKIADEHHFIRPGSDADLLLAMLQTLFADGVAVAAPYADGLDAVRESVAAFTPEHAEARTGIDAEVIRRIAREFAGAERAVLYGRIGVSTHPYGTVCQWAINCLNALTGRLDAVGGALFTSPAIDVVGGGLVGRGHHGRWRSRVRSLPESGGELPVAALREEISTPGQGQVRALLTVAGNPVLSTPDGAGLARSLPDLDFMASIDIYLNETTRHADVILPPTTLLERDHYDLVFQTLAVRNTARFTPAVFPKPDDARHDWEIYRDLALRLSARLGSGSRRSRLKQRARFAISPTHLVALLLRRGRSGITLSDLRARPSGIDLGPLRPDQLPHRLPARSGRIDLAPDLVLDDVRRLAQEPVADANQLVLIGRRHQRDCNSWLHNSERLVRGKARHQLLIHPDDLWARGLTDGERVRVTSRVGAVEVEAAASPDLMPGVVSLPHGYGHHVGGTRMRTAEHVLGVSINDLTDPGRLDVSGNAALTGLPVQVESLSTAGVADSLD